MGPMSETSIEPRATFRETLAALPALAALLWRLVRDPRVDRRRRLLAVGAAAYAASPIDLIPNAVPVLGKADDLLVVVLALRMLLDGADEEVVAEHWDGPPGVLEGFDDLVDWAAGLVPSRLRWFVKRLVER
jgi:uncharacterized membrane protein YkvA (DUF1232 family)